MLKPLAIGDHLDAGANEIVAQGSGGCQVSAGLIRPDLKEFGAVAASSPPQGQPHVHTAQSHRRRAKAAAACVAIVDVQDLLVTFTVAGRAVDSQGARFSPRGDDAQGTNGRNVWIARLLPCVRARSAAERGDRRLGLTVRRQPITPIGSWSAGIQREEVVLGRDDGAETVGTDKDALILHVTAVIGSVDSGSPTRRNAQVQGHVFHDLTRIDDGHRESRSGALFEFTTPIICHVQPPAVCGGVQNRA